MSKHKPKYEDTIYTFKTIRDFFEARDILGNAIGGFERGEIYQYKVVATELRKLLCEVSGGLDTSIIGKIFGQGSWAPLSGYSLPESLKDWSMNLPVIIDNTKGEQPVIDLAVEFNPNVRITKNEWLEQPFVFPEITVRRFIKGVADKEGAHSDTGFDDAIKKINSIKVGKDSTHKFLVVAIGKFILHMIKLQIERSNLEEKWRYILESDI